MLGRSEFKDEISTPERKLKDLNEAITIIRAYFKRSARKSMTITLLLAGAFAVWVYFLQRSSLRSNALRIQSESKAVDDYSSSGCAGDYPDAFEQIKNKNYNGYICNPDVLSLLLVKEDCLRIEGRFCDNENPLLGLMIYLGITDALFGIGTFSLFAEFIANFFFYTTVWSPSNLHNLPDGDMEKVRDIAKRYDIPLTEKRDRQLITLLSTFEHQAALLNRRHSLEMSVFAREESLQGHEEEHKENDENDQNHYFRL